MRASVTETPEGWVIRAFPRQDSSLLSVLADANTLLVRAPNDPARVAGESVEFLWL
jgi:molybdopterin molybdotransferase